MVPDGAWVHVRDAGFDVNKWRVKCQCKHTHEEHDPNGGHRSVMHHCPSVHIHRRNRALLFGTATCTSTRHPSPGIHDGDGTATRD